MVDERVLFKGYFSFNVGGSPAVARRASVCCRVQSAASSRACLLLQLVELLLEKGADATAKVRASVLLSCICAAAVTRAAHT